MSASSPFPSPHSDGLAVADPLAQSTGLSSLVAELDLPRQRGRPAAELSVSTVRSLTVEDLPALRAPAQPASGEPWRLKQIRHVHHQIARLVALGHSDVEVGLITGYTPVHVRNLKDDPQFTDLVSYYSTQIDAIAVEAAERLKTMGLSALEVLQDKLDNAPEKVTFRETMEAVELGLIKPFAAANRIGAGGAVSGGASVAINVKFVSSSSDSSATIDVTPNVEAE